jgi:hypothetical protein
MARAAGAGLTALGLALAGCQEDSAEIVPPPSPPPTATPAPATTTAATAGAGELANATIAMPFSLESGDGVCPSRPLRYDGGHHQGETPYQWFAAITSHARADVDRDGVAEFIVKADCSVSDGTANQILALQPDGTGGWATLGVVAEHGEPGGRAIQLIGDFAVTSAGDVIVNVANKEYMGCDMRSHVMSEVRGLEVGVMSTA